jgi:radical SAM superfamily enzyme YgiQ (UPF0313 family)
MSYHGIIFSLRRTPLARGAGAHRIATVLRQQGWDCEVVDFTRFWTSEEIKELLRSRITNKTVFVGFSVFFNYWETRFDDLVDWLKSEYPNVKTIIGGQSVALTPAKHIDYWVDSYGEVAIVELLKHLTGNKTEPIKFDFNHLGKKKLIRSISAYPAYPLESYGSRLEKRDFLQPYEWLTTEFSRGCKFSCDFCNFPILGVKGDYSRSQVDFEQEMKYNYDEWGITDYYVADETFNDSTEKIRKFADVADQLSFNPYFNGFIRGDLLVTHKDSWPELVRLGFGAQYYGIESFNHKSAKVIGKGMRAEKIQAGLLEYKNYMKDKLFFRGVISLIVGLPHETAETMQQSENWLRANWTDQAIIASPLDVGSISDDYHLGQTNVSEFRKNLEKYGLRPMANAHINRSTNHSNAPGSPNAITGVADDEIMVWEHDTMNLPQAIEIATRMLDIPHKLVNWHFGVLSFTHRKHIQDIPDAASYGKESRPDENMLQSFIKEYKTNKLNWLPKLDSNAINL